MPNRVQIDVPLGQAGLSQRSDQRYASNLEATQMQNCVAAKDGAVRKRLGNVALSKAAHSPPSGASSTIAAAVAGGEYAGAPWLSDGNYLYEYGNGPGAWKAMSRIDEVAVLDRIPIDSITGVSGATPVLDVDVAATSTLLLVAYSVRDQTVQTATTSIAVTVIDVATKAVVFKGAVATNGTSIVPRILVCGTTAVLTYILSSASLVARTMDLTQPWLGFSAATTLATDGTGNFASGVYDAAIVAGDATRFATVYESANFGASGNNVVFKTWSASSLTNLAATAVDGSVSSCTAFALRATSGEQLAAVYHGTAAAAVSTRIAGVTDGGSAFGNTVLRSWGATPSPAPGRVSLERLSSTSYVATWSNLASDPADQGLEGTSLTIAGGAVGPKRFTTCVEAWSRIANVSGVGTYQMVRTIGSLQGTMMLVAHDWAGDASTAQPYPSRLCATVSPRLSKATPVFHGGSSPGPTVPGGCCSLFAIGSALGAVNGLVSVVIANTSVTRQAIFVEVFDVQSSARHGYGTLGNLQAIAAGAPQCFDGQRLFELGYAWYPEGFVATPGTGGSMAAGTYSYVWQYEWYDARGNVHRSAASTAVSATVAATGSVAFTKLPSMGLASRGGLVVGFPPQMTSVFLVPYRTLNGGTIYYRAVADPAPSALLCSSTEAGSPPYSGMSYTDTLADASISSNALLNTTGGILDSFNPPSARIAIQHRNRWWLAGCDDPTQIWPSLALTTGECPRFNEALNFLATGAVRALASLDDKLVVFVQRGALYGIEYITGDGPTDLGTQSDWTPPQPIPSDVGAVDQRSICVTPVGVLFRAPVGGPTGKGGIFLLSRDLQVSYIGKPVEDALQANPTVTSMVLHPNLGRVYISLASDGSGTNVSRVVWDYTIGREGAGVWSLDLLSDPDTSSAACAPACAWVAQGASGQGMTYHWATTAGRVYRESNGISDNSYTDAGSWISMVYQSAWIKPTLSGFARFWLVSFTGDALDPANVSMVLSYDYSSIYTETTAWTAAQLAAFVKAPLLEFSMVPGAQKSKAIRVLLADFPPTGGPSATTGQGVQFSGLSFDVAVKDGPYRNLPVAQRS